MDVPRLVASVNRILAGNLTIQGQGGGREAPLKPIRWVPEGCVTSKSPRQSAIETMDTGRYPAHPPIEVAQSRVPRPLPLCSRCIICS